MKKVKSQNIFHSLQSRQYGRRCEILRKNPNFFELVDKRLNLYDIPKHFMQLQNCCNAQKFDVESCTEILKNVAQILFEKASSDESNKLKDLSKIVNDFYGPEILVHILCYKEMYGLDHLSTRPSVEALHNLYSSSLDLLRNINCHNDIIAKNLGLNKLFIEQLFSLLKYKETYVYASHLLEDILRVRHQILSLNDMNLEKLIFQMNDHQLANFCRVLYFVLTDAEACDDKNTLFNQDTSKVFQQRAETADENQRILLLVPEFLPRVCSLASESIDKSSPFSLGSPHTPARLQQLTSYFSGVLDDFADENQDSDGASFLHSPYFTLSIKFFQDVMLKVEALFVLCVLLTGKYKTSVQKQLANLYLIPKLCVLFDELKWIDNSEMMREEDNQCAQESALKIQFLRLIHSFCDHNDKKYILLTPIELKELKTIYEKNNLLFPEVLQNFDHSQCCDGKQGLLTKTLDMSKTLSSHSVLQFWFFRALEGFLRGKASYADQVFLIKRGLLKHLLQIICSKEIKSKEVLQSSFDLLGELMKFNHVAFKEFTLMISEIELETFIMVMTSNVIDSNMFIRSLVLSYEHFLSCNKISIDLAFGLSSMVSGLKKRVHLLLKLIMSVTVDTLTQENVSCLNTAIVFFMFSLNKGELHLYLRAFQHEEAALKKPGFIIDNLRMLLKFWKSHYLSRGKDCSALEQSSCIEIKEWRAAVDILLKDVGDRKAVMHYTSTGKLDRNS